MAALGFISDALRLAPALLTALPLGGEPAESHDGRRQAWRDMAAAVRFCKPSERSYLEAQFISMPTSRVTSGPRGDLPAYSMAEAAVYVRVAPATLRSWVVGREYPTRHGARRFHPLIRPADPKLRFLSFNNLVEAHVLRALRTTHGTSIGAIRKALDYAERELSIERLLLSPELRTDKRDLFLDRYGQLINLSRSGQLAMRAVLERYVSRIEWDDSPHPRRLYPFVRTEAVDAARHIAIDPEIGFGRPIVSRRGVSTRALVDRVDAGETVDALADDYGLDVSEIEEAIVYERAA